MKKNHKNESAQSVEIFCAHILRLLQHLELFFRFFTAMVYEDFRGWLIGHHFVDAGILAIRAPRAERWIPVVTAKLLSIVRIVGNNMVILQ